MKVFVSASSKENISDKYDEMLLDIAKLINKYDDTLIVGGRIGSMGKLLNNVNKSKIVINERYKDELLDTDDYIMVNTSVDRTNNIIEESDLYVIMPGSIGTVSELLSILESKRSDLNNKKLIVINIDNYYDTLFKFINETKNKGFIDIDIDKFLYVIDDISKLEEIRKEC